MSIYSSPATCRYDLQHSRKGCVMSVFPDLIKEKRLSMKLSLRSAAKMIGISYTYLDILEKSVDKRTGITNKPTPETLEMIASAYRLDYNYLLSLWGYIKSVNLELPSYFTGVA